MTTALFTTVVRLPSGRVHRRRLAQPAKSSIHRGRVQRQLAASAAVAAIGLVLTALSLSHLAHGVAIVTGIPAWQAWATAIGFDLTLIALESAQLCAISEAVRKEIARWARPSILGVLIGSACMNAFAFGEAVTGWWLAPAIVLGIAIPCLIYVLTRISVALYIATQR
ncbi:hypothetical protein PQJ75_13860 [Rhodoplanes sp. TEM]|uniref:CNNM transmembrane domain-containing protein n=1 Tax=Rhodoplanes tepidamans TaxID=200616 RepID=A0ABT5JEE4_RHOTP|nr:MULTISPECIES: hypothetical protein [Rhodoplanes]MDC7787977.1 hypothetical protein [Rhodoplanes tepidamans]MDC7984817.1 hypothetical protein [Rhodoplanes sp. TEM]MDQ0358406.1 hypothetical protein [Rhodoplanes tepidamans]